MTRFLGTFVVFVVSTSVAIGQPPGRPSTCPPPGGRGTAHECSAASAMPKMQCSTQVDADSDGAIITRELRKAVACSSSSTSIKTARSLRKKSGRATERRHPGGLGAWGQPAAMIDRMMENDRNGDGKLTKNELPRHIPAQMLDGALTPTVTTRLIEPSWLRRLTWRPVGWRATRIWWTGHGSPAAWR